MATKKTLGQVAYETYHRGLFCAMPWRCCESPDDWERVAQAVKRAVLREQRRKQEADTK